MSRVINGTFKNKHRNMKIIILSILITMIIMNVDSSGSSSKPPKTIYIIIGLVILLIKAVTAYFIWKVINNRNRVKPNEVLCYLCRRKIDATSFGTHRRACLSLNSHLLATEFSFRRGRASF